MNHSEEAPPVPTIGDILHMLHQAFTGVWDGTVEPKRANTMARLAAPLLMGIPLFQAQQAQKPNRFTGRTMEDIRYYILFGCFPEDDTDDPGADPKEENASGETHSDGRSTADEEEDGAACAVPKQEAVS